MASLAAATFLIRDAGLSGWRAPACLAPGRCGKRCRARPTTSPGHIAANSGNADVVLSGRGNRKMLASLNSNHVMAKTDLLASAQSLPEAWRSSVVGRPGSAQLKVLRMDGSAYPAELHPFTEALLVLDGQMNLEVDGTTIEAKAGEVYMVPAGQAHAVAPGSHGTLVIVDSET